MKFLEEIAKRVIQEYPQNMQEVAVVLPSKRAGLFLKKYLADILDKPFFPPQVITFNEVLAHCSEKKSADLPELLFLLYETYREIVGVNFDTFDRFSKWGPLLLNDFNEIDRYLIDPQKIFTDLKNIKIQELEIEHWSFHAEDLTISQKNYLEFWKGLPYYHEKFNQRLQQHSLAYQGALYKEVALNIESGSALLPYQHLYFAGFNALSSSEMKIISYLYETKKASLFFDADKWYTNNGEHEAGLFFRKLRTQWGDYGFELMGDHFRNSKKNIQIVGAGGQITQARVAGELLHRIHATSINEVALVLADENLLLPVLNSLPNEVDKVNITMGFPLRNSDYYNAIETLFEINNTLRNKESKTLIYQTPFLKLITHPIFSAFLGKQGRDIKKEILEKGMIYFSWDELKLDPESNLAQISFLFKPWKNSTKDGLTVLLKMNKIVGDYYLQHKKDQLTLEYIYHFSTILDYVNAICNRYPYIQDSATLLSLIRQYIGQSNISFYGEPLSGIQLMGMLETRALDFKQVIVLGVNENTLPKSKKENSFILHEVKKLYGLPTYREKDAVFANHFYRLLQRCENAYLVYNTDTDALQGGEKSRFIQQLEYELKQISPESTIDEIQVQLSFDNSKSSDFQVKKTPFVIEKIKQHLTSGISPSALNTYLECPLNYYYRYVLGLKEPENLEEVGDTALLGTIIHAVLEEAYQPMIGKQITTAHLEMVKKGLDAELQKQFKKEAPHLNTETGKNHLLQIVAEELLLNYLNTELELSKSGQLFYKIQDTEQKLERTLAITVNNEKINLCLKGTADRIDFTDQAIRIIDYKTGRFSTTDISIASVSLEELRKKAKSIQVLVYALLYEEMTQGKECSAGIVPLKNRAAHFTPISIGSGQIIEKDHLKEFQEVLQEIITEMLNPEIPFIHHQKSEYCVLCN